MFSKELESHLGKTDHPAETFLLSTSPILQWTIHIVGQRHREIKEPGFEAGLAMFDKHQWRECKDTAIFRVKDLCDYFASKGYAIENKRWK